MPQVPTYDGPQVAADPIRPVQSRPLDVSSGTRALGQGLDTLAEGLDRYAEREAQAQAFNAEDAITTEWLQWDTKARAHYVGEKAAEYEPAATAWWNTAKANSSTGLNLRAQRLVGVSLAQKRTSAMASVLSAAGAEQDRHADQVALADLNSTLQFGVTTGNLDAARQQIGQKVAQMGARKGWRTGEVIAAQGEYLSQMHIAAIDNLPSEAGLVYFQAHREEIDFDKQGRMEKYLERSIEIDAKRREADAEKTKRDAEDATMNQALSLYANNDKVPPSLMSTLAPRDRIQLQNMIETRAAGREVKTDITTYLELNDAIGRGEAVDLRKYSNAISTSDLKGLAEKQGKSQQEGFLTDAQRQESALTSLGIDKKKNAERAYAVLGVIDQRTREASTAKGNKPLTPDEKQTVIDSVVLDRVYVNSNWWYADPQKAAPLITPEEAADAYVMVGDKAVPLSVVPADKRISIIRARRARGLPVTEQAIVETYLRVYPNGQ